MFGVDRNVLLFVKLTIECGSVHTQLASTNLTRWPLCLEVLRPLTFPRHNAMSSRLSSSQASHFPASLCHRWQPRHWCNVASVLIPRVISEVLARHDAHVLAGLGAIGIPQTQHRICTIWEAAVSIAAADCGSSIPKVFTTSHPLTESKFPLNWMEQVYLYLISLLRWRLYPVLQEKKNRKMLKQVFFLPISEISTGRCGGGWCASVRPSQPHDSVDYNWVGSAGNSYVLYFNANNRNPKSLVWLLHVTDEWSIWKNILFCR